MMYRWNMLGKCRGRWLVIYERLRRLNRWFLLL
jgi:hypothetical protein